MKAACEQLWEELPTPRGSHASAVSLPHAGEWKGLEGKLKLTLSVKPSRGLSAGCCHFRQRMSSCCRCFLGKKNNAKSL